MELKANSSMKYIDIKAKSCKAYVRCDTAEAAQTFVQKSYEGRRLTVLEGKYLVNNIFITNFTKLCQFSR